MEPSPLSLLIRDKLPDAVVRDDHCDVVRVAWQGRAAYVEPHEGTGFQVRVSLRSTPNSSDSVPGPQLVDFAADHNEAAEKIDFWLKQIAATSLEHY